MDFSFDRKEKLQKKIADKVNTAKIAKIKYNLTEVVAKYGRIAASGAVVLALVIVCVISLVERNSSNNQSVGVMMSMSNLAAGRDAFDGKSFDAEILDYSDMLQANSEAEQKATMEQTEQQIDMILSAVNTDQKDSATLNENTGETTAPIVEPEPTSQTIVYADGSVDVISAGNSVTASPSVAPTYASADGAEYMGEFLLTGYCACPICCGAWSNIENPITASGEIAAAGRTIAADTSMFAFGTKLLINGQVYVVEDRGSAIKGNHIDIFFSTHEEALEWGKRYSDVYKLP